MSERNPPAAIPSRPAHRPAGTVETAPRKPGGGAVPTRCFADIHRQNPDGSTNIRLPNSVLAWLEKRARSEGETSIGRHLRTRMHNCCREAYDSRIPTPQSH